MSEAWFLSNCAWHFRIPWLNFKRFWQLTRSRLCPVGATFFSRQGLNSCWLWCSVLQTTQVCFSLITANFHLYNRHVPPSSLCKSCVSWFSSMSTESLDHILWLYSWVPLMVSLDEYRIGRPLAHRWRWTWIWFFTRARPQMRRKRAPSASRARQRWLWSSLGSAFHATERIAFASANWPGLLLGWISCVLLYCWIPAQLHTPPHRKDLPYHIRLLGLAYAGCIAPKGLRISGSWAMEMLDQYGCLFYR